MAEENELGHGLIAVANAGTSKIVPNYNIMTAGNSTASITYDRFEELEDRILQLEKKILSMQLEKLD